MATPQSRSGSDATAPPVPFSYAQAAKGLAAAPTPAAAPTKPSPETANTQKDASAPSVLAAAGAMSWADDIEVEDPLHEKRSSVRDNRSNGVPPTPKPATAPQQPAPAPASVISSPDLGASSSSTVTKDDDVSSLPNTSSESTWENKSQASTSVDKSNETIEESSESVKSKDLEHSTFKPLQEAPIPAVNIWKQRADEAKAKAAQRPAKPSATSSPPNGVPQSTTAKKTRGTPGADKADSKEKSLAADGKAKGREEEKAAQPKKDAKPDAETDKIKKGPKGKTAEKDAKPASTVVPPPPARDQESWPTPETVIDEDRKKTQIKGEKVERERKESVSSVPHGKQKWVEVPYTPNVIFNTPLPGSGSSRRGGRGGGRGGAQAGGRAAGYGANGNGHPEKDGSALSALPNGEQPKRGRPDGSAPRDASPPKGKRAGSAGSPTLKDKSAASTLERPSKPTAAPETETHSRKPSTLTESTSGAQSGQTNALPRQYPTNRPNKGRKGDTPSRRDGDANSPPRENISLHDRRTSTATQTDVPEDGERRASTVHEGPLKQGQNDRRPFNSFSGRDRPRGGARGGRGNYQNGYTNGHTPLQSASFSVRSPTTFHPEHPYFPPASTHPRGFRANGQRAQSVTDGTMYGRVPGYPGGPQLAPIQTYMPQMYEYSVMQPMTAVPFSPYGVDPNHLFAMVTTQLEYYFSVDNLCKDMFLRKHMDSKGFVYLSFIADFNRIKHLTTDMELIKMVCYQSNIIDFRIGQDGKERVRRGEGWEQWVLDLPQRDKSAQNDGPDELHNPPYPQLNGFNKSGFTRFPDVSAVSPTGTASMTNDIPFPTMNGGHPGGPQTPPAPMAENIPNGSFVEGLNGSVPNGHPIDTSTITQKQPAERI